MRELSLKTDNVGDTLPASDFNANIRNELQNVVTSAGFTLDPEGGADTNLNMLGQTVAKYANASWYYQDSGTANNYLLSRVGTLKSLDAYVDGVTVLFKIGNTNTGASTINVDSIGSKNLTDESGNALVANALLGGSYAIARYNSTDNRFELVYTSVPVGLPRGYIDGLILSNNGVDGDHDIDISIGECRDSTNSFDLSITSVFVKQIDATWAAGTNQGGLFSGTVAADTWYHVFAIRKNSDGSIDFGFDTSVTAANIPSGYSNYRRIGSVLTDSSSNIIDFSQIGDEFLWLDPPLDFASTVDTSGVTITITSPPDVKTNAELHIATASTGAGLMLLVNSLDQDNEAASETAAPLGTQYNDTAISAGKYRVRTNTSAQIRARCQTGTVTTYVSIQGWIDNRGKE